MFALPSQKKYSLEKMSDVIKAQDYFLNNEPDMDPIIRREFCTNLSSRQKELGIKTHEKIAHYASSKTTKERITSALRVRLPFLESTKEVEQELGDVLLKSANADNFVKKLAAFDKKHSLDRLWDGGIPNPVLGIFIPEEKDNSIAEVTKAVERGKNIGTLTDKYAASLNESIKKDGIKIFDKISDSEKKLILNLIKSK